MIKPSSLISTLNYDLIDSLSISLNLPIKASHNNLSFITLEDKTFYPENYRFYISQKKYLSQLLKQWSEYDYGFLIEKDEKLPYELIGSIINWTFSSDLQLPDFFNQHQTYSLNSSDKKNNILKDIELFLQKYNFNKRIQKNILYTIDELLMNALFDAPINKTKEHIFQNIPRHNKIALSKPISIKLSYQNDYLAISVKDEYGSLKIESLISNIQKVSKNLEYKDQENSTGAGLGLAQSIQKGANLIFKVSENNFTEVLAIFPNVDTYKKLQQSNQVFIIQKI